MKVKKLHPDDAPPRPHSQLRFTVRTTDDGSPSTLPPPPFEHETDVAGLEWWLEAHMNLAGGQLCVEQILAPDDAFERAVSASLETLRDALYEMYCDAADPRMRVLAQPEGALGAYVRSVYSISDRIVAAMLDGERDASKILGLAVALRELGALPGDVWLGELDVDANNPLEPLRRLARDAAALTSSVGLLARVLQLKG